jgi:hypothetical protein
MASESLSIQNERGGRIGRAAAPAREAWMKRQLLLAAFAGFALVSAAPSGDPIPWEDEESLGDYPACSRTVTDRCIQGPGREATADRPMPARKRDYAAADVTGDYPPCSASVTDRCTQIGGRSHRGDTRMARSAPAKLRATQLAMRAGERG